MPSRMRMLPSGKNAHGFGQLVEMLGLGDVKPTDEFEI